MPTCAGCSTSSSQRTSWSRAAPARSPSAGSESCPPRTSSSRLAGLLITLEGPEGAGKSTQLELLRERLADRAVGGYRGAGGTRLGGRGGEVRVHGETMNPAAARF